MLRIRREQLAALEQAVIEAFEEKAVKHLRAQFSEECDALGEEQTLAVVRHGIQRAESYGIRGGKMVLGYLELTFQFGADFDTDPAFPWAGRILQDEAIAGPGVRMDRLSDVAALYEEVAPGIVARPLRSQASPVAPDSSSGGCT